MRKANDKYFYEQQAKICVLLARELLIAICAIVYLIEYIVRANKKYALKNIVLFMSIMPEILNGQQALKIYTIITIHMVKEIN